MLALLSLCLAGGSRGGACRVAGLLCGVRSWLAGAVKQARLGVQGVAFHLADLQHGHRLIDDVRGLRQGRKEEEGVMKSEAT